MIVGALVDAETGNQGKATIGLGAALTQARGKGYVALEMETQLALGLIQIRTDPGQARLRLQGLQEYAMSKGFGLIAHKAEAFKLQTRPKN
jgi:hypothetical protein